MKSGFVAIIGRPNVGKSTIINSLIGQKISIVSAKAQTTRNIVRGIYDDKDCQIIFIDTINKNYLINVSDLFFIVIAGFFLSG